MSPLHPQTYDEYLARKKRQDQRRRESVKKQEDKHRQAYLDGEGPYSSLSRKPKSREKWVSQYGSEARVKWGKARDCDACGRPAREKRPNLNCHMRTGGTAMKAGPETMVTLCPECDNEIAQHGIETFCKRTGFAPEHTAAYVHGLWTRFKETTE